MTADERVKQFFARQVATHLPLLNNMNWTHRGVEIKTFKN